MSAYEVVIGLEVHAQLKTNTKLFCRCENRYGAEPNSLTCPVCLGMPGALPTINGKAVEQAMKAGLAMSCTIHPISVFARKNYFYPDLPKGYQISQFDKPLCTGGHLTIDDDHGEYTIGLERIHMEEDAGKLLHGDNMLTLDGSLVDLNRAGVPLIEIVGKPDLRSPVHAALYLKKLRQILRFIDVCDGNMEEGSLRCDANVSMRRKGVTEFGTKVEVKNMNSFKNVQKAIEYEMERQTAILESGQRVKQETRLWNPDANETVSMRSKENAHDYRYFPDPDLKPLFVSEEWLARAKSSMAELPEVRSKRFVSVLGLPKYDADVLTAEKETADFFEETLRNVDKTCSVEKAKQVSNYIMSEIMRVVKEKNLAINTLKFSPSDLAELLLLINDGTISGKIAKEVLEDMTETGEKPKSIVGKKGLTQISDESAIRAVIQGIVAKNASQAADYKNGKEKLFGFFVGQAMKETQGKANPTLVNTLLKEELAK